MRDSPRASVRVWTLSRRSDRLWCQLSGREPSLELQILDGGSVILARPYHSLDHAIDDATFFFQQLQSAGWTATTDERAS